VECFAGRGFGRVTHTPRSKCVKAADKGLTQILYGKAEKKRVRWRLEKGKWELEEF
jgi:hypothetical protein